MSTQTAVYFAVNPSLNMFRGFAQGCFTGGRDWRLQLSAISSYAPIRIWKINPYVFCPQGNDGSADCGPGNVKFKDIPDAFTDITESGGNVFNLSQCYNPFSVEVSNLEYINAENIAVTILKAPFSEFNPDTGLIKEGAQNVRRVIMFMSTVTMALSEIPWERDIPISAVAQGTLCPAMRRLPNVGSFFAEIAVAGVNLSRTWVRLIVSLPGVIEIWGKQQSCSLVTRGHSLLRMCGADLLSLDDFFEALNRANSHYWRAYAIVSEHLRDLRANELANVVDGVAYYGEATLLPNREYRSIVRSIQIPTTDVAKSWMSAMTVENAAGTFSRVSITPNPLRLAQFSYKLVTGAITDLIPLFIRVDRNPKDTAAAREILALLTNRIYDTRDAYYASVTLGMLQACNGLSLMVGFTNPWGVLIRKQCESLPTAFQGVYDLVTSIVVDVPFTKCMCIDTAHAGAPFKYAIDNCYYFAPNHLKPLILSLVENDQRTGSTVTESCSVMVDYTAQRLSDSMQPWFNVQFQAAEQISSSVDYLLKFLEEDAGRCVVQKNNLPLNLADRNHWSALCIHYLPTIRTACCTRYLGKMYLLNNPPSAGVWTLRRTPTLRCCSRSPWTTSAPARGHQSARASVGPTFRPLGKKKQSTPVTACRAPPFGRRRKA